MKDFLLWLKGIVANNVKATVLILAFIVILCLLSYRCSAATLDEVDLRAGTSYGPGGEGPVLGFQLYFPVGPGDHLYAGTHLWGATQVVASNWDWHGGYETCRGRFCADLGAAYLQRTDSVDGSHANFNLELRYLIGWKRVSSLDLTHLSNAGTTLPNLGRNAVLVGFRLQ
jgi:Lipid A 3-O-deacylase (PagL)